MNQYLTFGLGPFTIVWQGELELLRPRIERLPNEWEVNMGRVLFLFTWKPHSPGQEFDNEYKSDPAGERST